FVFFIFVSYVFFLFFFSSRRRHTRFSRDWSSDVCSSDLGANRELSADFSKIAYLLDNNIAIVDKNGKVTAVTNDNDKGIVNGSRSEERRVGKHRRQWRTTYKYKIQIIEKQ